LKNDPTEMNNLYNNPDYVEVQNEMHQKLTETRLKYSDSDELDEQHLKRFLNKKNL